MGRCSNRFAIKSSAGRRAGGKPSRRRVLRYRNPPFCRFGWTARRANEHSSLAGRNRAFVGDLSLEVTRKGEPGLLAFPTADLDQLVCRVYQIESLRSALRTGIWQRQVEFSTFVDVTIYVLPPISLASQRGTLHRITNARAKLVPPRHRRPAAYCAHEPVAVFWQKTANARPRSGNCG